MKTKELTRRERQAEQLKKEILEAAITVFKQNGYEKATTKKIAKEADVSEGTLYYYFENKREILITLFKILIESITENLAQIPSTSNEDITKLLSKGMVHQYGQVSDLSILILFLHEARIDPEVRKIFSGMMLSVRESAASLFKNLEKDGKIRKVNHDTMAVLMSLIGIGYMALYETGDDGLTNVPVKKLTDEFAQILVNGIKPVN